MYQAIKEEKMKLDELNIEAMNEALKLEEKQREDRDKYIQTLQNVTLPKVLDNNSDGLTLDEEEELENDAIEVDSFEDTIKVNLTLQNTEIYPKVKRAFQKKLAKLRGINLIGIKVSDFELWLDIVKFRTTNPLEFEGK